MTRACQSCGSIFCDQIECYLDSPSDFNPPVTYSSFMEKCDRISDDWREWVIEVEQTGPNRFRSAA